MFVGCGIDDECLVNQFCRDVSHKEVSLCLNIFDSVFSLMKLDLCFQGSIYSSNILGSLWSESSGSLSRQWTKIFR